MRNCKEFQIPIEWMLDNGIIGKVHHTMHQSIQNVNDKCAREYSIVMLLINVVIHKLRIKAGK